MHTEEAGHAVSAIGALPAAAGAVMLGFGAANDTGWLAITGGIVAGLGILVYEVVRHTRIDYQLFSRLDRIEREK
ncbi:MAG TPA: hypothetical protein PKD75_10190 [Tepidiformaceae bacterium]|nr:hypothetical protein [Tepidiformaceae bacterium]